MPSLFQMHTLRRFFSFHDPIEASNEIAAKTARKCLKRVVSRVDREGANWSSAQLRGYLRAISTPWIDGAIDDITAIRPRTEEFLSVVRIHTLNTLEQLVLQELKNRPFAHSLRAAAA
jgi:hypothetical protein